MKTSSLIAYYFIKLMGVAMIGIALVVIYGVIVPDSNLFETPDVSIGPPDIMLAIAAAILLVALGWFLFRRICLIWYDDEKIQILNNGVKTYTDWNNVCSVIKIPGCAPPLYRMSFHDDTRPAYFIMSMFIFVYALLWAWDFTGFYGYAREKIEGRRSG